VAIDCDVDIGRVVSTVIEVDAVQSGHQHYDLGVLAGAALFVLLLSDEILEDVFERRDGAKSHADQARPQFLIGDRIRLLKLGEGFRSFERRRRIGLCTL